MPGGVSSPVRAFKSVGGNPIVFDRVKGAYAWDVDGNKFIDYVGTWGPAILGHADDDVLNAVKKTMDKGEFLLGQLSANVFVAYACARWFTHQLILISLFNNLLNNLLNTSQQQELPSVPPAHSRTNLPRPSSPPSHPLKWSVLPTREPRHAWA